MLGIENVSDSSELSNGLLKQRVIISEMPFPSSLCVPKVLSPIVTLDKPIEEIMAGFDKELRRKLKKNRSLYSMKQVFSDAEIEYANSELIKPYAIARYGSLAFHYPLETVRRIAKIGRLDFIYKEEELVACTLSHEYVLAGKRYWLLDLFGYPEAVFSDSKRLGEINSINNHMALECAIENGYDFVDIGFAFARPFDGLLIWKKRRGAALKAINIESFSYFHVYVPKAVSVNFFWDKPLFSIEHSKLTLHLGFPERISDEEFLTHYREMRFDGLFKVYIHCSKAPSENLLTRFGKFYKKESSAPILEIILLS